MSERDAVLFANEAFYQAFAERDITAMDEVWARNASVVCVHPGWPPVSGRDEILQTWAAILSNENAPNIQCRAAEVYLHGAMAFVVCFEEIDGQFLIATNVFVREGGPWRMVHHQAGPTSGTPPEDDPEEDERPTLN